MFNHVSSEVHKISNLKHMHFLIQSKIFARLTKVKILKILQCFVTESLLYEVKKNFLKFVSIYIRDRFKEFFYMHL